MFPADRQLPAIRKLLGKASDANNESELNIIKRNFAAVDIYFDTLSIPVGIYAAIMYNILK